MREVQVSFSSLDPTESLHAPHALHLERTPIVLGSVLENGIEHPTHSLRNCDDDDLDFDEAMEEIIMIEKHIISRHVGRGRR